jgi:uncharacterized membrane protein YheB (UPF0754 family)
MNWSLLIILLVVAALIGWLANRIIVKLLFRKLIQKQPVLAQQIGAKAASLISFEEIEQKITSPEAAAKILPVAEVHIDDFLRNKLKDAFPMIGMLIGDRTIGTLKGIFMKELESIFPVIIGGYVKNWQSDLDIEQLIAGKIAAIPPAELEAAVKQTLTKELRLFQLVGALVGLLIAIVQILLTLLLS